MSLESFYGGKQGVSPVIKAKFKYITAEQDEITQKYYDEAYGAKIKSKSKLTEEEAVYLNSFFNNANYREGQEIDWSTASATAILRGHSKEYPLITPFVMDECLKLVDYTDVWYGELCIIDTDSKMNPNNGKLYRRTLKQTKNTNRNVGDTLYAEYIGQIVGPSGGVPNFDFGSLDTERKKAVGILPTYEEEIASEDEPLSTDNWDYAYPKDEDGTVTNTNPQNDYKKIAILSAAQPGGNEANIQIKPGKEVVNNKTMYNDTIRYTWCNVQRRLDGKDDDAWIYLGFEIPYSYFDAKGDEIPYWDSRTNLLGHSQKGIDNKDHPFYHNLHFYIPRGARGIGPEEIFCINPKDEFGRKLPNGANLYTYDAISYNQEQDKYVVDQIKKKTVKDTDSYWVGKWCIYNPKTSFTNTENKDVIYIYLGSYKDVRAINLSDDGTLTFTYSDDTTLPLGEKITWITSASIDTDDTSRNYGQFKITFNNNEKVSNIDKNLHLIKNVTYDDKQGQIKFDYSGGLSKTAGNIEYIKSLKIDTDKNANSYGKVTGMTNTETSIPIATLPLIKDTTYNAATGEITFKYSTGDITPDEKISYISKMKVTDNGTIQYQLNTESGNTWHNITDGSGESLRIKDIDDLVIKTPTTDPPIQVSSGSAINGHLYVKYRGETNYEDLGLVKGNAVVGPVYTLKNGNNPYFNSKDAALGELQDSIYDKDSDNSIGGNHSGKIKVNGEDVTGGLVAAQIKNEGENTEPYTALFYYDTISDTWVSAGLIGEASSDSGSNVFVEQNIKSLEGSIIYPQKDDINPEFYLKDGADSYGAKWYVYNTYNSNSYDYSNWDFPTKNPLLGPMPWQIKNSSNLTLNHL